jgi:DNA-binding response OmpR family regulator
MSDSLEAHVLLADDQPEVRQMLEAKFRREGYRITTVENGAECLDVLTDEERELPDLVILDVMMPRMDGFRALDEIRETHGLSMPAIMLTARGQEEDTVRALDAGATDYVTKPFSPNELLARIARHL